MTKITKDEKRIIITDFAADIKANLTTGKQPDKEVIFFRKELQNNKTRPVVEVPTEYLRFRKDNGRIASDVISYEKEIGPLDETEDESQEILRDFLAKKDPETTEELILSIRHRGQIEPAIITIDGFLINGNRRKVALEKLHKETKDDKWRWMKVVILPGEDDEGGPPTLKEIEQIENRYQLQSEGKSEYTLFDRALSIRRKIKLGIDLEEQLKDDSKYANLPPKTFKTQVKKYKEDFLEPVEAIDRYLDYLGRERMYSTITTGPGDREGRWQAFLDYSNTLRSLKKPGYRKQNNLLLTESELGDVEEIAFKMIRKRVFPPSVGKVHNIMRARVLGSFFKHQESKDEILILLDIPFKLSREEIFNDDGKEYSERDKDKVWGKKHGSKIIQHVKKAKDLSELGDDKETPLKLLEDALKKLNHREMVPEFVEMKEIQTAVNLLNEIIKKTGELKKIFFDLSKDIK